MEATPHGYEASDIKVLEGLEAVRKRPAMYIGSTDGRGLHHLVYEVVDNSVDEALAGYCTRIDVIITRENGIRVDDNGRGIPTDIHPTEGIGTVELVMTKLHAGGKFNNDSYKVSAGLHGVGVSCVNALSSRLEVTVYRDDREFLQTFRRGAPVAPGEFTGASDKQGTSVYFQPDARSSPSSVYNFDTLSARLRELAFLNKGLTITIHDEREEGKAHEFCFPGRHRGLRRIHGSQQETPVREARAFRKGDARRARGNRLPLQRRLYREPVLLRQQREHRRRRHARHRLQVGVDPRHQQQGQGPSRQEQEKRLRA